MPLSSWTFFDYAFVIIIVVSTATALTKGLTREIVSLVALIGGFALAVFYYPVVSSWLARYTRTEALADLTGLVSIFVGSLAVGALVAFLINRIVKMASLQWMDRLLGGFFGFIRGWAVASVIVLAFIAFPVWPGMMVRSQLAPFLLAGARTSALLVPKTLKEKFHEEYKKVLEDWNQSRNEHE